MDLPASVDNGTASVSLNRANAGRTVTVTVKPDEGYQVSAVTVTDAGGKTLAVKDNGNGTWSFTMPSSAVTVTPVFTKIGASADSGSCPKDASCPISAFNDASPTAWYHDGVHWALEDGIMNGVDEKLFAPDGSTTRAMIVTMLWRMENEPGASSSPFRDVPAGQWYTGAVNWAAEQGIVNGYDETTFGPMDPVTREQLAAILFRYAQFQDRDVSAGRDAGLQSFSDASSVSDWALSAMQWAVGSGILNGRTERTLAPGGSASRAEVATMLMRYDDLN